MRFADGTMRVLASAATNVAGDAPPRAASKVVAPRRNSTRMSDFDVLRKLGKGSFGVVWAVTRKRDARKRTFVIKQIAMGPRRADQEEAINECRVLAKLDSPHVVKYYESFIAEPNRLCIVMEFAPKVRAPPRSRRC